VARGTAIFVFFLVVSLLALQANMTTPARLNLKLFLPALGLLLVYIAGWTVVFFRMFRRPNEERK